MEFYFRLFVSISFPLLMVVGSMVDLLKAKKNMTKLLCAVMIAIFSFLGGFCFNYVLTTQ